MLTFLLKDDRDHIWVVVSYGHVEGRLHGHTAGVIGQSLLRLQVGIGALLKQLCRQARQSTAAGSMEWALALDTGKEDHLHYSIIHPSQTRVKKATFSLENKVVAH